jgi:hypothetical protein
MPFYAVRNTTPLNTLQAAPSVETFDLGPGIITRVFVQFPAGCVGMVFAQVMRGGAVIWPTGPEQAIAADARVVEWVERYHVPQVEQWRLVTWSPGTTNQHNIDLWLEVQAPVYIPPRFDVDELLAQLNASPAL